jgi:hypothetical protein
VAYGHAEKRHSFTSEVTIRELSRYMSGWASEPVTVGILPFCGEPQQSCEFSVDVGIGADMGRDACNISDENFREAQRISVKVEIDFDGDLYADGVAVAHGGFKLPVLNGFDRLFVEPHPQAAQDVNVARAAVGSDD